MPRLPKIDKIKKEIEAIKKINSIRKLGIKDLLEFSIVKLVEREFNINLSERILNITDLQLQEAEKTSKAYRNNSNSSYTYPPYKGYDLLIVSLFTNEELKIVLRAIEEKENE